MPLDAQGLWERDRVLLADDMIAMLEREIGPLEEIPDRDPRAPGDGISFRGRNRAGRLHRVGEPAVLPELQSHPADLGRQAALLPVRDRGDRRAARCCAAAATDEEIRAAIRESVHAKWIGHEINSAQFRAAAAADVLDRRLAPFHESPFHESKDRAPQCR